MQGQEKEEELGKTSGVIIPNYCRGGALIMLITPHHWLGCNVSLIEAPLS